ncbi:MAG: DUF1330 domain-containing protein [Pseudomonadales bacterium]|jgi:uncharacterized protein (DUF1330 family)|nr:DUF1330 domain-containing protein [Pseudomonadales bacterium]
MTTYVTAQINIHDREKYAQYEQGFMEIFASYEGKMLAVDEAPEVWEGQWSYTRTVLIEFPSAQAAKSWYSSDEYQQLAAHRWVASTANIAMIEGVPLNVNQ